MCGQVACPLLGGGPGSLPRLHLKLNDFWQFTRLRWRLFASQRDCEPSRFDCEQEETVTSWYNWRMAFAWLMVVAIAGAIYFAPITSLVDSLGD